MSAPEQIPSMEQDSLLRFLTCGNVDDGKSTLIGRLLYDSKTILADTLNTIARNAEKRGLDAPDLALLTDGLQAEREQGITIDVAYRYFSSARRKYIIADAPGHEQYTRNMVTAASTAQLAIILIDARKGVQTQTRRHSTIAHLLRIPQMIIAINKMDLVDHSAERFNEIRSEYQAFAEKLGLDAQALHYVPLSALHGDMVVERGTHLNWHAGPTLFELLETLPATAHISSQAALRLPVQYVCRPQTPPHHDFRGYMGRIEAGQIRIGDDILLLPSGQRSRVKNLQILQQNLNQAQAEQSVTVLLENEIDISRGDMLVDPASPPQVAREIAAMLCWLAETPLDPQRKYLLQHTTRAVRAKIDSIRYRIDVNTQTEQLCQQLSMNDIARVQLKLAQPICFDRYADNRTTGAFILIDESSNNTVGAGMIV